VETTRNDVDGVIWTTLSPRLGDANVTSWIAPLWSELGVHTEVRVLPSFLVKKRCSTDLGPFSTVLATRMTPGGGDARRSGT
jgi:hypothetical protein